MADMTVEEYREHLAAEVAIFQREGYGTGLSASFMNCVFDKLDDSEEGPLESAFIEGQVGRRNVGANGYRFDEDDGTLLLAICDFHQFVPNQENFTRADAQSLFKKLDALVSETRSRGVEAVARQAGCFEDTPAYDLLEMIDEKDPQTDRYLVERIRAYIFTEKTKSGLFRQFEEHDIAGIPTKVQIWDLQRLYSLALAGMGHEPIESTFPAGQIHLAKAASGNGFDSYLGVMSGEVLADMYYKDGSRLLEGNVRSFLSARTNANKGIRTTLKTEPERFFVYNNGIAVTVRELELDRDGFLRKAKDFQIINGGQTTASIARAKYVEKADISGVTVSMKLTAISPDLTEDDAANLIQNISRYSNNQNKVSEADFFSNHPFHQEMEKMSLRIGTPAGLLGSTYWFYERSRGRYEQRTMFKTGAQAKLDMGKFPKNQVIKKELLARVRLCWRDKPAPQTASSLNFS